MQPLKEYYFDENCRLRIAEHRLEIMQGRAYMVYVFACFGLSFVALLCFVSLKAGCTVMTGSALVIVVVIIGCLTYNVVEIDLQQNQIHRRLQLFGKEVLRYKTLPLSQPTFTIQKVDSGEDNFFYLKAEKQRILSLNSEATAASLFQLINRHSSAVRVVWEGI